MARQDIVGRFAFRGVPSRQGSVGLFSFAGSVQMVRLPSPQVIVGHFSFDGSAEQITQDYPAAMPIVQATPLGAIPQQGSAIFESWAQEQKTPKFVYEHWDKHHSGRARFADTRRSWNLRIKCRKTKAAEILTFINDHLGAGKSFYFYDLEANGFQYDPTGVLTTGRHTVRFVSESFPRQQNFNDWFTFDLPIVEVE